MIRQIVMATAFWVAFEFGYAVAHGGEFFSPGDFLSGPVAEAAE